MEMVTTDEGIPRIQASHDIGIVTAAKLIGIAWAGLVPLVFPAWIIVQGEIRYQNNTQDREISQKYVTKDEYMEFKATVRDLKEEVAKLRATIEARDLSGRK
jgi:cell division protein FtsB